MSDNQSDNSPEAGKPRAAIAQAAEPVQADAQPMAHKFNHDIGEGRFRVEKGAFWWHILIGEGTAKVGKFHSKLAAEDVALKLLTAFRDGAYMQWQAAAPPARQPLTEAQIVAVITEAKCHGGAMRMSYGSGPYEVTRPTVNAVEMVRAVERAHGIGEGEKP